MFTTRPELSGTFGMVASTHWLASAAGMAVLEEGGTAVDAAVATGFVLHVVEPHLNGPGGEVPIILARPGQPPVVLCGQGVAPAAATIEHYTGLGLDIVPGTGLLAATVPGAVPAWLALLRDHGTLTLERVLRFALDYAAHGHPLHRRVAATIRESAKTFTAHWTTSARVWLRSDGTPPAAGTRWANPSLARTYGQLLAAEGAASGDREAGIDAALAAWNGVVAEAVDAHVRTPVRDETGRDHAGVLTAEDIASWRPTYEEPVRLDWRGQTVCKVGPWCQGPAFLQTLAILDRTDAVDAPYGSTDQVHVTVEAIKLAMADREAWYGDSLPVPLAALLDPEYSKDRASLIGDRAAVDLRPGSPDGQQPRLPRYILDPDAPKRNSDSAIGVGEPTVGRTPGDTCHLDVVDRFGTVVTATPSGGWMQSSPVVGDLGFALGTRAQMFWLEPGLASSLQPGVRPRSTLTPTLVLQGDEPVLAFGTPGGDQQEQWQVGFWLAHAGAGMNLQAAIDAPTWHTTSFPSSFAPRGSTAAEVIVEERLGNDVVEALRERGHEVIVDGPWSLGRLSAVARDPETGIVRAAANSRGMQGYAAGR